MASRSSRWNYRQTVLVGSAPLPRLQALLTPVALVCLLWSAGCRSTADRHEDLVARWTLLYNSHDLSAFTGLYAAEGAYMTPGMVYAAKSPEELRAALDSLWRAYPDMRVTGVHSVVAGDAGVAFAWDLRFTAPTKAPERRVGASILVVKSGKIVNQLTAVSR